MYPSKVYTVSIVSSGVALEEEHIARETLTRWNIENGEKSGVVFQAIPHNYKGITPDIFIFAIDNYVDKAKVEAAIATGAKVLLFFSKHHDENNTLSSELQPIQELKASTTATCIDHSGPADFGQTLSKTLKEL